MQGIQYTKSIPRYLITRILGRYFPGIYTGRFGLVSPRETKPPPLPSPSWVRVKTQMSGICGSDLATIQAKGSPYFSPLLSFPFVLGHENVGIIEEAGALVKNVAVGDRVVVEPALCCAVREIPDTCTPCREGNYGNCENTTKGIISAGIQTGYCRDTGGGWSREFVAHSFQLHKVPDEISNEEAVLTEPFSCALHAALQADVRDEDTVLFIGVGSIGLLTIAALRAIGCKAGIIAVAMFDHQEKFARQMGADDVVRTGKNLFRDLCDITNSVSYQPELGKPVCIGGVDKIFDCVGSSQTIDDALRFTRARGSVILVGMPAIPKGIDWTAIWYKELCVKGTYTYGVENFQGEKIRTFELALRLLKQMGNTVKPLISNIFMLSEFRKAIAHALDTGRSKSVKTVFKL